MTRKQCKCQYVQEQGVIFAKWIFLLPPTPRLEKTQQCMGNKIFCLVFSSPKMQLKQKGCLCVFGLRGKRMKQVNLGREPGVSLSWSGCGMVNGATSIEFWVLRPLWCSAFSLYPTSHLSVRRMIALYGVSRREASVPGAASYTAVLWRMTTISTLDPSVIIVPTCSASLRNKTDDSVYF